MVVSCCLVGNISESLPGVVTGCVNKMCIHALGSDRERDGLEDVAEGIHRREG